MRASYLTWQVLLLCLMLMLMTGCLSVEETESNSTITVFTAASLTDAFIEIGAAFEAVHPGVRVTFNFAGSQQLAQQLIQGAPGDLFASADIRQMELVLENGRILPNTPQLFTTNQLIVIYPSKNPASISQLSDLAKPGVKVILAAEEVPVGAYSLTFLQKISHDSAYGAGFKTAVMANVVSYEQSVRAVYSKIALGEADAGIVYMSDVVQEGETAVGTLAIPFEFNIIAHYIAAPVADSDNLAVANQFIQFILSGEGQALLKKHGFLPSLSLIE
jgi:molybdate transport system substrate-binding protein